jgi:hypothetical protein
MLDYNDTPELYDLKDVTIPKDSEYHIPRDETWGCDNLIVETGATLYVDGEVDVFGSVTSNGTISGLGTVNDR